jgi:hypothetical protein
VSFRDELHEFSDPTGGRLLNLTRSRAGELRVDDGAPIELRPGVVVALSRGVRLHWRVDADFRELWVYS